MDRFVHSLVETSREAGYHVLLFSGDARRPAGRLRRPAALDRRRRLRRHRHLPRQPAGGLARGRGGRPSWPSAGRGTTADARHPWVDVDGAAGAELATTHLLERGHERIAWIGWRKDSLIGEDRRAGWSRAMRSRDLPTTGLASRVEDTVSSGREASAVLLDEARPTAFVCASDTLAMGVLHTLAERGLPPAATSRWSASTTPRSPRSVPPGLTSVRQPLEQVAVEVVKALEGLLGHPPVIGPGVLLAPTLAVRGTS